MQSRPLSKTMYPMHVLSRCLRSLELPLYRRIQYCNQQDSPLWVSFALSKDTASRLTLFATGHLLTRLSRQEPKHLTKEAARTLPLLIDRAGDLKEKYRTLAAQCLSTFWKAAPMDVERAVRNTGMTGKNSRAKETCINWLLQVHSLQKS